MTHSTRTGDDSMAVGAADFALHDLGPELDFTPCQHLRDVPRLLSADVVELQDNRVGLSAVQAWIRRKVCSNDRSRPGDRNDSTLADTSLTIRPLTRVSGISRPIVGVLARLTPRLQPWRSVCLEPPAIVIPQGLDLVASGASLGIWHDLDHIRIKPRWSSGRTPDFGSGSWRSIRRRGTITTTWCGSSVGRASD
jgi:hypothetical protein